MWAWLNANSVALQSISSFASVLLTALTIWVLVITWKAIKRQAEASERQTDAALALTEVAREQTKAANDSAESARRQSDLLSAQIEQSTAPLLVAEPDERPGYKNYKLVNRGAGIAFQIHWWQGGLALKDQSPFGPIYAVQPATLGSGNWAYLPVPPAWETITVRYKGIDREERWTVVYRDPTRGQDHIVKKGKQEFYLS